MDPRHSRRLAALVLLCCCFLLTSWLESAFNIESLVVAAGRTRTKRSSGPVISENLQALLKKNKVKNDLQFEKLQQKLLKKKALWDAGLPPSPQGPTADGAKKATSQQKSAKADATLGIRQDMYDLLPKDYFEEYREEDHIDDFERVKQIRSKVYRCLPKFICEVHSQSPEEITTDFEREWLNMYSPSLLSDRVHDYQVAAHMGQLFRGYQPSPCMQLYTGCPITMGQLKKFVAALDIKKNRF